MNEHVDELISALIDDEVTEEQRMLVEEHITHCSKCKQIYDELYALKHATFSVYNAIPIPSNIQHQVMTVIVQEKRKKSWTWWPSLSLLVLFLLLIILSPIGGIGIRITSSLITVSYGLLRMIPILLGAVPYLFVGITIFAGFLLLFSFWTLRRLLMVKEIG